MSSATEMINRPATTGTGLRGGLRRPTPPTLLRVLAVLVVAVLPLYLSSSLLQTGLFCMSAIIGAIGLNLLSGNTGQVSLAHAFFLAAGAYGYAFFAGKPSNAGAGISTSGLQLPTVIAAILAVLLAGFLGLLFSPISSRLRGIYLGIASLALVFIGQHILFNAQTITGGFNGRNVPTFNLFGLAFDTTDPSLYILNVEFGKFERLWYLGLVLVVVSYIFAKTCSADDPVGRCRWSATARSPPPSWASTSAATRPRRSYCPRCTPAWPECCSH